MTVLVLFCGGGGSSAGVALVDPDVVGVDHDADSCRTHQAAGHPTVRADLRSPYRLGHRVGGIWASPPCTAFSTAGKGAGRALSGRLQAAILAEDWGPWGDAPPDVWLILPTMESVIDSRPDWVVFENVTTTRPVMDACAVVLERYGYQARTIVLSAEQYGVAQTRRRCFLVANRAGFGSPTPTHQRYRYGHPAAARETLFGVVLPWVSMAAALGWGTPERPYFCLSTAGGARGGADEQVGGSGARRSLYELARRRSWVMDRRSKSNGPGGIRVPTVGVPVSSPAPTLTAQGLVGQFVWRSDSQPHSCVRALDEPAGTIKHGHEPPSWVHGPDTVRLTVAEAARLQAFHRDHPWVGSRTSQFRQIGNSVPPPVAAVVAATAAQIEWVEVVADYLDALYRSPVEATA